MTLKELSGLYYIDNQIKSIESEIASLRESAERITSFISDMPKGCGGKNFSEWYVEEGDRIRREIKFYEKKIQEDRKKIDEYIDQAPYPECDIIRFRAINNLSWEEIGDYVGYSRRQASKKFWNYINNDRKLQDYVKEYYRLNLVEAIQRQQLMSMNGRTGAVCAFLYTLVHQFGKEYKNGWLIDFPVTNEDIAGFCGISTRNSVNRILHNLKEQGIIDIQNQKILVMDMLYMQQYVQE